LTKGAVFTTRFTPKTAEKDKTAKVCGKNGRKEADEIKEERYKNENFQI